MKPYSNDLREKIIRAYQSKKGSMRGLAELFSVSLNFVWLLLQHFRDTGTVAPKAHGGGPRPQITPEHLTLLKALVEQQNDATLVELRERFHQKTGIAVSRETITRGLKKLNITRKKKTFHATERENAPDIIEEREAFIQTMPEMDVQHLDVIDECGIQSGDGTRVRSRRERLSCRSAQASESGR